MLLKIKRNYSVIYSSNNFMNQTKNQSSKLVDPSNSIIKAEAYNEKLDQLLNKIETQNRYSNRISITNILNLSKLQTVKRELDHIMEIRKIEELNQVQLKNLNSDLNKQIKEMKEKLELTSVALLQTRKEVKRLNEVIVKLEEQNLEIQQSILHQKRENVQNVTSFKMSIISNLLESQIKDFLAKVKWKDSILIDHCRQCVFNEDFEDFFGKLEEKLSASQNEKKFSLICPRLSRSNSRKRTEPQANKTPQRTGRKIELNKAQNQSPTLKRHRRVKTLMPLSPAVS